MSLLTRPRYFEEGGSADGWSALQKDGREWERFYRERWQHDKVVRSTHGVNCTAGRSRLGHPRLLHPSTEAARSISGTMGRAPTCRPAVT